jgi:hypothetical protein
MKKIELVRGKNYVYRGIEFTVRSPAIVCDDIAGHLLDQRSSDGIYYFRLLDSAPKIPNEMAKEIVSASTIMESTKSKKSTTKKPSKVTEVVDKEQIGTPPVEGEIEVPI